MMKLHCSIRYSKDIYLANVSTGWACSVQFSRQLGLRLCLQFGNIHPHFHNQGTRCVWTSTCTCKGHCWGSQNLLLPIVFNAESFRGEDNLLCCKQLYDIVHRMPIGCVAVSGVTSIEATEAHASANLWRFR